jgi:hypothetical protein
MKKSKIIGFMLLHTDGDKEYYSPKLAEGDEIAIYKILEKYGDNNESCRGNLKIFDVDEFQD